MEKEQIVRMEVKNSMPVSPDLKTKTFVFDNVKLNKIESDAVQNLPLLETTALNVITSNFQNFGCNTHNGVTFEQLTYITKVMNKMAKFFNEITEQCLLQLNGEEPIKIKNRMILNK
jgi:hypothetical protein